jgi:uncharacterized iron-regulated membrane protein
MSSIRLWHSYIGILIAPSVIFFALTGALRNQKAINNRLRRRSVRKARRWARCF